MLKPSKQLQGKYHTGYDESSVFVANASGIFNESTLDALKVRSIQQIWRDHLFALSMFISNRGYDLDDFVFLYP